MSISTSKQIPEGMPPARRILRAIRRLPPAEARPFATMTLSKRIIEFVAAAKQQHQIKRGYTDGTSVLYI